jgi:hypothetical protein
VDNNLTRLAAGMTNLALAAITGSAWPATGAVVGAAGVGFLGYGVSLVLFVLGLRHLGTARTSAYFSAAPFIGAMLSIALVGEAVTVQLVLARLLMGVGLYLHLAERHEHEQLHGEVEHEHRHMHDEHHQHVHEPNDPPGEPHTHRHRHTRLRHSHPHYPDPHHQHGHAH